MSMPAVETKVVSCPTCHEQLPARATHCNFCHSQFAPERKLRLAVSELAEPKPLRITRVFTWQDYGYIVNATLVALAGIFVVLIGSGFLPQTNQLGYFAYPIGAALTCTAIGLFLMQFWAQMLTKALCSAGIALIIWGELQARLGSSPRPIFSRADLLVSAGQVAVLIAALYLVSACSAYPHTLRHQNLK